MASSVARATVAIAAAAVFLAGQGVRSADENAPVGSALYHRYCAACHGASGLGDGVLSTKLKFAPTDLTRISQRNKGTFPAQMVRKVIDGREPVNGHGGPDMPAWNDALRKARDGYDEAVVAAQIDALVKHVEELQVPVEPRR